MTTVAAGIEIGVHKTAQFFGMTFNLDTLWSTGLAALAVVVSGLLIGRRATSGVPTGAQLLWETVVGWAEDQVESYIGMKVAPFVVPLAVTLFFFILVSNWIGIIPTNEIVPAPTADINLTLAMAVLVIVWVWVTGIRKRRVHYFSHFFKPYALLAPINFIEEIVRPVTLAMRLFGNIFSAAIMISVIGLLPVMILWFPTVIWKLIDMGIGAIQAFIFALLTILYFSFAVGGMEEPAGE